jgi:hypothetical protein
MRQTKHRVVVTAIVFTTMKQRTSMSSGHVRYAHDFRIAICPRRMLVIDIQGNFHCLKPIFVVAVFLSFARCYGLAVPLFPATVVEIHAFQGEFLHLKPKTPSFVCIARAMRLVAVHVNRLGEDTHDMNLGLQEVNVARIVVSTRTVQTLTVAARRSTFQCTVPTFVSVRNSWRNL